MSADWPLIIIILGSWLGMALTSETKDLRNRRLLILAVIVFLSLLLRWIR